MWFVDCVASTVAQASKVCRVFAFKLTLRRSIIRAANEAFAMGFTASNLSLTEAIDAFVLNTTGEAGRRLSDTRLSGTDANGSDGELLAGADGEYENPFNAIGQTDESLNYVGALKEGVAHIEKRPYLRRGNTVTSTSWKSLTKLMVPKRPPAEKADANAKDGMASDSRLDALESKLDAKTDALAAQLTALAANTDFKVNAIDSKLEQLLLTVTERWPSKKRDKGAPPTRACSSSEHGPVGNGSPGHHQPDENEPGTAGRELIVAPAAAPTRTLDEMSC